MVSELVFTEDQICVALGEYAVNHKLLGVTPRGVHQVNVGLVMEHRPSPSDPEETFEYKATLNITVPETQTYQQKEDRG